MFKKIPYSLIVIVISFSFLLNDISIAKKTKKAAPAKKAAVKAVPKAKAAATKTGAPDAQKVIDDVTNANQIKNEETEVIMKIFDAKGEERTQTRKLTIYYSSPKKNENRTLLNISAPGNLKGTKILTLESENETGQWIYLSSFKKVNRITSSNDSDGVLDSDLSYSDLKMESNSKFIYQFVTEGEYVAKAQKACEEDAYAIVSIPRKKSSNPYKKRILSISKKRPIICRVDLLGMRDRLLKTIENSGYENQSGAWRPKKVLISSYKPNGSVASKTEIVFMKRKADEKIEESIFSPASLLQ